MTIGTCDCCEAQNVELSRSELAGLEPWSCLGGCKKPNPLAVELRGHLASIFADATPNTAKHVDLACWVVRNKDALLTALAGPDAIDRIDSMLEQERSAAAKAKRGSSAWIVAQENISHFVNVRECLVDFVRPR